MGNSSSMKISAVHTVNTQSESESESDEDFDCPICQEVFRKPVRTKTCKHVFCKSCFETAVERQSPSGPHCPLCRTLVSTRAPGASDVLQKMRQRTGQCRACGAQKFLSKMRLHYKSCRKYKEEFGLISDPPSTLIQTQNTGLNITTSTHTSSLPTLIMSHQPHTTQQSEGRVYSCPYCPLEDLMDLQLVLHCVNQHATETTPAVCPICARMPFGNLHYISRNLILHLLIRHQYSYTGYMNEEDDEDVQLSQALLMSVQEF